ncbi:MAG: hypothetical protein WC789_10575 [Lentisphaeria bacterium]
MLRRSVAFTEAEITALQEMARETGLPIPELIRRWVDAAVTEWKRRKGRGKVVGQNGPCLLYPGLSAKDVQRLADEAGDASRKV